MTEGLKSVDSVQGQHEEVFEHNCSRCEKKEKNAEASCYCRTCDKYFCTTCRDDHGEFASDHAVLGDSERDHWGKPRIMTLDMDECPLHEGHNITIFCEQHEALGCNVCVSLKHSLCEKKSFIPDLAKDIANNQEMGFVLSNTFTLQNRLRKVRSNKKQMQTSLNESRTKYREKVADYLTKVYFLLNSIQSATDGKMEQLYQTRYNELETHLDICDTLIQEFTDLQSKLDDVSIVDTKRFVFMKNGKEQMLDCMEVLNELSQPINYDIVFSLDKSVLERLGEIEELGQFSPYPAPGKSTEITGVRNFKQCKVRAAEDKKTCDIQGICMLADGTVILSDHNNRNIKRLDANYVTREVCHISGNPGGVCCTGKRSVAVALGSTKKVQMVSVSDKMRTTEELVFKHSCTGLAYYKGTLYITSGVGVFDQPLYMYTLEEGSMKTTCQLIRTFNASSPRSIALSGDGNFVYLLGTDDKLTIQNRHGDILHTHPTLSKHCSTGVCVDMDGNVLVSLKVGGIIQFKDSGKEPNGQLIKKDELTNPEVVFVDNIRSRLIVQRNKLVFGGSDTVDVCNLVY